MYKHINKGQGIITVFDSYGKGYTLLPNCEITIDRIAEGNGVVVVNDAQQVTVPVEDKNKKPTKKLKTKKNKESDL